MDQQNVETVIRQIEAEAEEVSNAEAAMFKAKGVVLLKGARLAFDLCASLIGINISAEREEDCAIGGATMLFVTDDTYHIYGPSANVGDVADEEVDVYGFEQARDILYAAGWGNLTEADFIAIFKLYDGQNVVFDREFAQSEYQEFCRIHKVGSWAE